jgi:hypothetical protein
MNYSKTDVRASGLERGFSTISAMFWLVIICCFGYVFFQALPALTESFAVSKAVRSIVAAGPSTPLEVQNNFDRQKSIDGIVSISGRDLEITREDGVLVISYAYERKIQLTSDVFLLIRYQGSTRKGGR